MGKGAGRKKPSDDDLRRFFFGQSLTYVEHVFGGYVLPATPEDRPRVLDALMALVAVGLTRPSALRRAPWLSPDELERIVGAVDAELDAMLPDQVDGRWLGQKLAVTSELREKLKVWKLWPAGWTREQLEEHSRQRNVEKRREKRRQEAAAERAEEKPMDYEARVRARPRAVLELIPLDRPISVAELTTITARRRDLPTPTERP